MKILLLFLSFLVFNSFLSFAAEPVLDINGDEVLPGNSYYIVSAGGGGVKFGRSISHEICPLSVVQERWDLNRGSSVTFTPANSEDSVIRLATDINIRFSGANSVCNDSNVWRLDYDTRRGRHFIATDGVEGNPGCQNKYNWFQMERSRLGYNLAFCPAVEICEDVGILYDRDGTRRLTLSDTVVFQKASDSMKKILSIPLPLLDV